MADESTDKRTDPAAASPILGELIMGGILSGPLALGIFVVVGMVPGSIRLAGPVVCPAGTVRTSILRTTRIDNTHGPKEVTQETLQCHDAAGRVTPVDGWQDLEVMGVMAGYSWVAAAVGLIFYRLLRGRWWKGNPR